MGEWVASRKQKTSTPLLFPPENGSISEWGESESLMEKLEAQSRRERKKSWIETTFIASFRQFFFLLLLLLLLLLHHHLIPLGRLASYRVRESETSLKIYDLWLRRLVRKEKSFPACALYPFFGENWSPSGFFLASRNWRTC